MRYIYESDNRYISKFAICEFINSTAGIDLNVLYMILLIAQLVHKFVLYDINSTAGVYVNLLYMALLIAQLVYI